MKTIEVMCSWESTHKVEVPDDFYDTGYPADLPQEALDQLSPRTAMLVEWQVVIENP